MKTLATLSLVALALATAAQAADPERGVKGSSVYSAHDPTALIELPASVSYVGADRWILDQYADDVELHAFVDADKSKRVQKLYWVQFEAYLSSRPELHHTYDSKRHVTLGGMDFLVDAWLEKANTQDVPDSDSAHLHALLAEKGYTLPAAMMSVRFVHLMDEGRKELMFIYSEPIPKAYTADELEEGGTDHFLWNLIEKDLMERGEKSIQFH